MQPEARLVKKIIDTLNRLPECYAEKNHGTTYGHQKLDVTGACQGVMFQIEVKTPGNKPTPRQISTMKKWFKKSGCVVGWAVSPEEAVNIINPIVTGGPNAGREHPNVPDQFERGRGYRSV
jgi:hypothetical protein